MLPNYLSDHAAVEYKTKTIVIDNLRLSYVSSASIYSVFHHLWLSLLEAAARQEPRLLEANAERDGRIKKCAEIVLRTELSDIETMHAARDLSEFLVGNADSTQKAVKLMAEAYEQLGRTQAELDLARRDLDEAEDMADRLSDKVVKASFIKRLIYLFTGRLS